MTIRRCGFSKSGPDYDPVQTRTVLAAVDISDRRFVIPYDYTAELVAQRKADLVDALLPGDQSGDTTQPAEDRSMWLPEEVADQQQAGGTWSEMFNPDGLLSRSPVIGAAVWWLAVLVLGWLAFPLAFVALRGLPSKGYLVSKALALLIVSWLSWLAASSGRFAYTRSTIWAAVAVLALAGAGVGVLRRRELVRFVRAHWRLILVAELTGVALLAISLLIRSGNPDLWHPSKGGEKPLDFAYLNAVIKSTTFPPYDPWLSGAYINYYYFGYVVVGSLTKLLGVVPYVAYNLALPMLFSLTGTGAFSVAYDLAAGLGRRRGSVDWRRKAMVAGLAALIVVVLFGNLGQIGTIVNGWNRLGGDEGGWVVQTARGLVRNLKGEPAPMYIGSWYWDATRVIPPGRGEAGPITEFPFFTYLYADLHAHMIDMPFFLLGVAWALGLAQLAVRSGSSGAGWSWRPRRGLVSLAFTWLVGGLVIGVTRPTNTWDWPTLVGVGAVTVAFSAWRRIGNGWRWVSAAVVGAVTLIGLSSLLFLPFLRNFVPAFSEVSRWQGGVTPIWAYFAVHGLFLFVLVTLLIREFVDWSRHLNQEKLEDLERWGWLIGLGVMAFVGAMAVTLILGIPVGPFILLMMVPSALLALRPELPVERRAVLMLFALGLAFTLAVELVVFAGDISRMNTVFKFYNQVWLLYSVIGGAALIWCWDWVRGWRGTLRQVWVAVLALLIFAAALYPPTAARAKIADRFHADQPPAGLNGMRYMVTATYYDQDMAIPLRDDYYAIRWLQDNVIGSPVIIEASIPEYRWGNRISINTGLPAVVGWSWPTRQHRAAFPDASEIVRGRVAEVAAFYDTTDIELAVNTLRRYNVSYVIVGGLERAYFDPAGIAKFEQMLDLGLLRTAYENAGTTIYQVQSGSGDMDGSG